MATPKYKTRTTSEHTVTGEVPYEALTAAIAKQLPAGSHSKVRVELFVDIPGGGDWSNEELDVKQYPVQFRATWVETTESLPQTQYVRPTISASRLKALGGEKGSPGCERKLAAHYLFDMRQSGSDAGVWRDRAEARAAVIERVRALPKFAGTVDYDELREALAAAPEATAPIVGNGAV